MKYVKVMDGLKSNAGDFEYRLNEVNVSNNWNPTAKSGKECIELIKNNKYGTKIFSKEITVDSKEKVISIKPSE